MRRHSTVTVILAAILTVTLCGCGSTAPTPPNPGATERSAQAGPASDPNQVQAFTSDGLLSAVAHGTSVQLWDTHDPDHPVRVGPAIPSPGGPALALSFSPDKRSLAIGGSDHKLQVWDVSTPSRPVLRAADNFGR